MPRPVAIAVCLLAAVSAQAADPPPQPRASITKAECQRLMRQMNTKGAAYRPGVDVHGKPVKPADMAGSGGGLKILPEVIEFNYTINPVGYGAARQAAAQAAAAAAASASIGSQQTQVAAAQAANTQAVNAATLRKASLQQTLTTLQAETTSLTTAQTTAYNNMVASTLNHGSPAYQALVAAYREATANVNANTQAIAAANASIAAQTAIISPNQASLDTLTTQLATLNYRADGDGDSAALATAYTTARTTLSGLTPNDSGYAAALHDFQAAQTALNANYQAVYNVAAADVAALAGVSHANPAYQTAERVLNAASAALTANTQAIADTSAAQAEAQAAVTAGTTPTTELASQASALQTQQQVASAAVTGAQAQVQAQAAVNATSNTQMNVAAIRYDVVRNRFTINGQPIGPEDKQAIAARCKQAGFM
jgi:hypothetical protein